MLPALQLRLNARGKHVEINWLRDIVIGTGFE